MQDANDFLWSLFENIIKGKKTCCFMKNGASIHTANYSVRVLRNMFDAD